MTRTAYGLDTPRDLDWRQQARCAQPDVSPDRWHTDRHRDGHDNNGAAGWARHICLHHCPVLAQCRADTDALEPEWRQSCVLGGVIYDYHGRPAAVQRLDEHCWLCAPAAVVKPYDAALRRQKWREQGRRRRAKI